MFCLEKSLLVLLFLLWLYWVNLLRSQYNWNVVSMFNSSEELKWKAFMIVSIAISLYPFSLLSSSSEVSEENGTDHHEKNRQGGVNNEN